MTEAERIPARHPSNRTLAEDVDAVFTFQQPRTGDVEKFDVIRQHAKGLALVILQCAPECADRTAAIRKVREAVMNANAAIALDPEGR